MAIASSFTISLGLFYLLMAVIALALFRTAAMSMLSKTTIMMLIVVTACSTFYTLPGAFGYPVETVFSALPQQAELISFHPYDDEKRVDLWLMPEGAPQPRAYSVELTDELKNTLRQAQKAKADGARAMLAKAAKPSGKNRPGYMGIDGGTAPYVLLPDSFSLPKKDGQ